MWVTHVNGHVMEENDYGVHPTSNTLGTGDCFPSCKVPGAWSWPLISTSIISVTAMWSITSIPPFFFFAVILRLLIFNYFGWRESLIKIRKSTPVRSPCCLCISKNLRIDIHKTVTLSVALCRELHCLYSHRVLFRWSNRYEWDGQNVWHVCGRWHMHTEFWWGNLKERDHLEDVSVDGMMILKWIFKKWVGTFDWINLSYDKDKWLAVVNTVMNLWIP